MKTLLLEDENLYNAIEAEAARSGRNVEDIVKEALEQWLVDLEMDDHEIGEIEEARSEWRNGGGVEAHEFFRNLRNEQRAE